MEGLVVFERSANSAQRRLAGLEVMAESTDIGDRMRLGNGRAAAAKPTGARGLQASLRAVADQLAREFADRAEDVEHQPCDAGSFSQLVRSALAMVRGI